MKKILSNKFANYFVVLFVWACTHALIYRLTQYLSQDLDVPSILTLWCLSFVGHYYNFKYTVRQIFGIYVGMDDASSHS